MTMENFEKKHARPLVFGLSTAAAVILGLSAFAAGDVSAQTPSGTSTSAATTPTATTTTSSGGTTTSSSPSASASKSATGVAGAPQTGSGVASDDSSKMPIVLGGLAAVGGGLALFGASMKKRNS